MGLLKKSGPYQQCYNPCIFKLRAQQTRMTLNVLYMGFDLYFGFSVCSDEEDKTHQTTAEFTFPLLSVFL